MSQSDFEIRAAQRGDLPQILDIFNEVVANSAAVYFLEPTTLEERTAWFEGRERAGFPVIVAVSGEEVLGFASFGEFRGAWPGYRYSVEHSVHVRVDQRGRGIGRSLLQALFPLAAGMGKHIMIGGIDADNAASIALHAQLGFEQVAHFHEVGHKFGRWLDLVFMQRYLDAPGSAR